MEEVILPAFQTMREAAEGAALVEMEVQLRSPEAPEAVEAVVLVEMVEMSPFRLTIYSVGAVVEGAA